MAPALTLATLPPKPNAPQLVLAPPWVALEPVIAAAGGRIIGPERAPFARIAFSDDPAFARRVREGGAWWIRDAGHLSQLCGLSS